jgi:hypothetical protein
VLFVYASLAVTGGGTERQEDPMERAVALAAAMLGNFLGIPQTAVWWWWLCNVLSNYWTRRR